MADIWVPLRAGSDIIFLGALIRYVLENDKYFHEYVVHYTNASTLLRDDFRDTEDLRRIVFGLGSGEEEVRPRVLAVSRAAGEEKRARPRDTRKPTAGHGKDRGGEAKNRAEMSNRPNPAESALRLSGVEASLRPLHAGDGRALLRRSARNLSQSCRNFQLRVRAGARRRAICYAVGWTQHSKGVQIIRTAAILQLLLGNIGRPGGGILALRGHASIQGSTDIPTLYDILPGYLPMPLFEEDANKLQNYIKKHKDQDRFVGKFDKYFISLMKA